MNVRKAILAATFAAVAWPAALAAAPNDSLLLVYWSRPDLQAVFSSEDWRIRGSQKGNHDLADLEDWARRWGYREHPDRLYAYAPCETYGQAKEALRLIYSQRPDLQAAFDSASWEARPVMRQAGLASLTDWAAQWGHREYPEALADYAVLGGALPETPARKIDPLSPLDLQNVRNAQPTAKPTAAFPFSLLTAESVLVADARSGAVLLAKNAAKPWPIASITKLMTAMVVLDRQVPPGRLMTLERQDEPGGARLRVDVGSRMTVENALYATLVGSANNAAYLLARSTGLSVPEFVAEMNRKAGEIGLQDTVFADPSGLDVSNVSTARDVARLLAYALDNYYEIRKAASTAQRTVTTADGTARNLTNTNRLLTDLNNGLYVLGGKTGYLIESRWNLAVKVQDGRGRPLLAVTFGAGAQNLSFSETERAVKWVWDSHIWP